MEGTRGSISFVLLDTRPFHFCWVVMEIVHDGARVESIDLFLQGKYG